MENKIDITELLKDCPKGMELDYALFEDTVFMCVEEGKNYPIVIKLKDGREKRLTKYGCHSNADYAKCVIFPKGKTTWKGFVPPISAFQFKDGDVIVDKYGTVAIYKRVHSSYEEPYVDFHCGITSKSRSFFIKDSDSLQHCGEIYFIRLATEEEKRELFDAIKANGYRWNEETKALEKLVKPIFKVGDRVKKDKDYISGIITNISDDGFYKVEYQGERGGGVSYINIAYQDEWELVPSKFDIKNLKYFDTVLVRNSDKGRWVGQFYTGYDFKEEYPFECTYNCWKQCIPFKGNEHLINTTNDCNNFYKIWES